MLISIMTIIFILASAVWDYFFRKIPNLLILIGIICGVILNIYYHIPVREWIIRGIFLIIIFFFGMKRLIGGGDIKMWMALTIMIGAIYSSFSLAIGSVLLIIFALIKHSKESLPATFISVNSIMMNKKLDTEIKTTKGYPLAVFTALPVTIFCVMELCGVGLYGW